MSETNNQNFRNQSLLGVSKYHPSKIHTSSIKLLPFMALNGAKLKYAIKKLSVTVGDPRIKILKEVQRKLVMSSGIDASFFFTNVITLLMSEYPGDVVKLWRLSGQEPFKYLDMLQDVPESQMERIEADVFVGGN